ncbi:DoxX family protein [Lewinella sp. IMCC34191]|uniref:DoxX family protein n=1 Tax=Lewinella sp. IMCC34191 TaxID=2259172 RepID=UPI000E23B00B|nr:DoxX family membrane protein [Lewinella sp. IMCC34191]
MTLTTLLIYIGIAALALTGLTYGVLRERKNIGMSLLQNFVGALFLFSGYVKAIDPLGTAYKMEQYFAEFEATANGAGAEFLAPIFPWLSEMAAGFSVFMIVLEIMLGLMLILGNKPRLTAGLLFPIVAFFTVLTGFTYLTGYVPSGVNFFAFGEWGPYTETNMKVTDCGCFGDFLKLEPRVSFLKDVALLIPSIIFLLAPGKMHQLFTTRTRTLAVVATGAIAVVYCLSNFIWDIPGQDFRPFKVGTDVAARKQAESDAAAAVTVLGYELTNKETGEVTSMSMDEFLKVYKDYPKEDWEIENFTSEPTLEATKISEFEVSDAEGYDVVPDLLADPGYTFIIVAYKLKGEAGDWDEDYLEDWREDIQPVVEKARAAGHSVMAMTKYVDDATLDDFKKTIGADYPFHRGDDILLKTIIRSNPGVVLMKQGVIVNKWHHSKLPAFDEIANRDILAASSK